MNLPSTQIRNWVLQPKKSSDGLDTIYITQSDAEVILRVWKNNPNADLRDARGNLLQIVNKNDYRIKGIGQSHEKGKGAVRWICDYGTRHCMSDKCDCENMRFNEPWWTFWEWCKKNYKTRYSADITSKMQEEYLALKSI